MIQLLQGNCLELMKTLPAASVDLVLCDLPYGVTARNAWDVVIPFEPLWAEYNRVSRGAVVLTATQPFAAALVLSNPARFKYEWVWKKSKITGVLNAKKQPVRQHEQVLVFYPAQPTYNPQGLIPFGQVTKQGTSSSNYGERKTDAYVQAFTNYPRSVLEIASEGKCQHPAQKPVALMEYLIKTYTNPGDTVLDNCMGSGTTGVACVNTGRAFIGMEKDPTYFQIAQGRISAAEKAAA
jgi:site-specific DNA-methyltransferase (adenine-specific)